MGNRNPRRNPSGGIILRVDKSAGCWEAVPVSLLEDARLAFDTRGFAAWLIARPDDWEIRAGALPRLLKERSPHGHVGRDKARRFLRELEHAGYLRRTRTRGPNGCWIWRSVFSAVSGTIDGLAVDGPAVSGASVDGHGVDIHQTLITSDGLTSDFNNLQAEARDPHAAQTDVGLDQKIQFPKILSGANLSSARALVGACPPELRQAVLDEVAAAHQRAVLRGSPVGLLHSLVQRAKAGTFVPSYAISYREKQRLEAQERARFHERRSQGPVTGPIPAGETAKRVLTRLRAKLKESDR